MRSSLRAIYRTTRRWCQHGLVHRRHVARLEERVLVAEQESDPAMQEQALRREQRVAVTGWPWKLIRTTSDELLWYRLDRDPGERASLSSGDPVLVEWADRNLAEPPPPITHVAPLDPDQAEALRALGYLD